MKKQVFSKLMTPRNWVQVNLLNLFFIKSENANIAIEKALSNSIELFKSTKDKSLWMGISIQEDLDFNKIIKPYGLSLIGTSDCLISYLHLQKI